VDQRISVDQLDRAGGRVDPGWRHPRVSAVAYTSAGRCACRARARCSAAPRAALGSSESGGSHASSSASTRRCQPPSRSESESITLPSRSARAGSVLGRKGSGDASGSSAAGSRPSARLAQRGLAAAGQFDAALELPQGLLEGQLAVLETLHHGLELAEACSKSVPCSSCCSRFLLVTGQTCTALAEGQRRRAAIPDCPNGRTGRRPTLRARLRSSCGCVLLRLSLSTARRAARFHSRRYPWLT